MLSATAILFLVGLPLVGSGAAIFVALTALRSSRAQPPTPDPGPARPQGLVITTMPVTLLIFALLLYILSSVQDREGAPAEVLEAAALAYGVPALLSGLAYAALFHRGVPAFVSRPELFSRVLTTATLSNAQALLALLLSILGLGKALNATGAVVEAARGASLYMAVGGVGAPLAILLFRSGWDFATPEQWPRAFSRAALGDVVAILFFVLAIRTLGGM